MSGQQPVDSSAAREDDQNAPGSTTFALPAPGGASNKTKILQILQTVKLDALGPMAINSDGILSRIQNWADMTEAERERTLRVLGKTGSVEEGEYHCSRRSRWK